MSRKILLGLVLCLAFALRWYNIDIPMWLDEIYGYRLARLGMAAIINNSLTDPHPPLYYLIQWVISGFGQTKTELGWRLLPLACGVLTVLTIWYAARKTADNLGSILCCLVAATAPSLIFYSQEARSYALMILAAAISTWLTIILLKEPAKVSIWMAWVAVSLLGLHLGYSYLMLAAVQIAFLGVYSYRRIAWWVSSLLIIAGTLPLIPFAKSSLVRTLTFHKETASLTWWRTLQTLFAGEAIRYGDTLAHVVFPILVIGISFLGVVRAKRLGDKRLVYLIVQLVLPLGVFFLVSPALRINLPFPEARQFLILMPAFFVLIGNGFTELNYWLSNPPKLGAATVIALCAGMILMNLTGLRSYWAIPKSPEGQAVVGLREKLRPGDGIVSLHHSTSYALGFYLSNARVYLDPQKSTQNNHSFLFQMVDSDRLFEQASTAKHNISSEQIRANRRFWLLAHTRNFRDAITSLVENCQITQRETSAAPNGAFELMLVECPTP